MTSSPLGVELRLARLALKHQVSLHHPKIEEARRSALLYIGDGMPAGEAVTLAEVHAFKVYALPARRRRHVSARLSRQR